ncbi:MAG: hypothetical protein AWU56_320 [Idiomarina sp. T82-3]|uniref:WYL domain-containing protein n=1 Tax=Idiomarina TaxID=135575 RepID=UPI00079AD183|nr:WYL domain-containing protein [Idiomarina sp. T82-3]KXS36205.1 MAG: hypothetical protein AWU56_320 [Idiomarina sp. T82-3]
MIEDLTFAQRERLEYIDFRLMFFGFVARSDLTEQFKIGPASSSRDFSLYKELAPGNLELRHETKRYYSRKAFKPLFDHDVEIALKNLANQKKNAVSSETKILSVDSVSLIKAQPEIVSSLTKAVINSSVIKIEYASLSSGITQREILPYAFLNSGQRWHIRAFDRKSNEFRDFVCTRILSAEIVENAKVASHEKQINDDEWVNEVTLQLVAHPAHEHPKAIELDYQIQDHQLELTLKVAEAKYLLRFWNVDVTPQHSLSPQTHHLWLKNSAEIRKNNRLAGALALAPGNNFQGSKNG